MKAKRRLLALALVLASPAFAQPELSGTPDQLAAHLRELPGQIKLTAHANLVVDADRLEMVLQLRSSDRLLQGALQRNQQLRTEATTTLQNAGIPAGRIRNTRFATTPNAGYLTAKVKSYEVESIMTVEAATDQEVQTVAALVDAKEEVSLVSMGFRDPERAKHEVEVMKKALAKLAEIRRVHEEALGVRLVPRKADPVVTQAAPVASVVPRKLGGSVVVAGTSSFSSPVAAVEVVPSMFDQVVYQATANVTCDVIPLDAK